MNLTERYHLKVGQPDSPRMLGKGLSSRFEAALEAAHPGEIPNEHPNTVSWSARKGYMLAVVGDPWNVKVMRKILKEDGLEPKELRQGLLAAEWGYELGLAGLAHDNHAPGDGCLQSPELGGWFEGLERA